MEKRIKGVLIDVYKRKVVIAEVQDDCSSLAELIGCNNIDVVTMKISGETFRIVCDEQRLLEDKLIVSATGFDNVPMLCGNLFVVQADGEELKSLTDKEMAFVMYQIKYVLECRAESGICKPVLTACSF